MKKLRTTLSAGAASLGLIVGMASFAGATSGVIDTTGPDSTNRVVHKTKSSIKVENNNNVRASNQNNQNAHSGDAKTKHNTKAGDARTGNASNANALNASVTIDNAGSAGTMAMPSSNNSGSIKNTGPDSTNVVRTTTKNRVTVTNNNNLCVTNSNSQTATTGNAKVADNTTGGSATSGNASNTNSTTMNFKVSN